MPATTDAQKILKQTGGSETAAYWELVNRYHDMLVAQAMSITGNAADAEDVVQETFCEALADQEKLNDARSLSAWLRTLNRSRALKWIRHKQCDRKHSKRMVRENPRRMVTSGGYSLMETRETLVTLIDSLSPQFQTILNLRHFDHLSYEEISEHLEVPIGSVGRLLFEATLKLRERVQAESNLFS